MSETASPAVADAITPANILSPASVPVPQTGAETKPATAPPEAATEPDKAPDNQSPSDEDAKQDKPDDPKRKASHRIGELYAKAKASERDAQTAWREVAELRRELDSLRNTRTDDFQQQSQNDMRAAVKEERLRQLESETARRVNESRDYRAQTFSAKIEAASERIPDLKQVLNDFNQLPVSEYAADVISESDKAAEIAWYLGKNPDEAHRIAGLPPHRQGEAIARIEAKVSIATPRKTSAAPPPVPMVGASSAPGAKSLGDMGVEDIAKQIYGRA